MNTLEGCKTYLESVIKQFLYYKKLGEQVIAQLDDTSLHWQYNQESNSITIIVQHLTGNMLSRFTDFLTTDGEKTWRKRDEEFEDQPIDRKELMIVWNKGWTCLLDTMYNLRPSDLDSIIYIRNEGHTVVEAINRQLAHYAYHVGQIVYLAKMIKDDTWETLSIPRNGSAQYNRKKFGQKKSKRHFTDKP